MINVNMNKKLFKNTINRMCKISRYTYFAFFCFLLFTINVQAIIWPSNTSNTILLVAGIAVVLGVAIGLYWKIKSSKDDNLNNDLETENRENLSNEKTENSHNMLASIILPIFFASGFLVFGTIQLYLTYNSKLWFNLQDVLVPMLLIFAVLTGILIILAFILKGKLKTIYLSLLFSGGLALFIQGNIVTTDYSLLEGRAINWNSYTFTAIWNSCLWLFIIILPFILYKIFPKAFKKILIIGSVIVLLIQIVNVGYTSLTTSIEPNDLHYTESLTDKDEFRLSSNENIIVFILDGFDSSYFKEFIEKYPEYTETVLQDFTYYPDTSGGGTRTVVGLPYILTGEPYTTETTFEEYLDIGYSDTKIYDEMIENNFDIGLYVSSSYVSEEMKNHLVNYTHEQIKVNSYVTLSKVWLKFLACRYFPHILKKYFWIYQDYFRWAMDRSNIYSSSDDGLFYQKLEGEGITVDDSVNSFRLYHLRGMHPPYELTENAIRDENGTSMDEQQKGNWHILNEYFNQMKELGIYDSATIIVTADHGDVDGSQNPILLIKKRNQHGYSVSNVPVSFHNLHATILDVLGYDDPNEKSIYELTEDDNKERFYYIHSGNELIEYVIDGKAYDYDAMSKTGRVFPIFGGARGGDGYYHLGDELYFDIRATGNVYAKNGFSQNEDKFTWTCDYEAEMEIPLAEPVNNNLEVKINFRSLMTSPQTVGISVNGEYLDTIVLTQNEMKFTIPKDMVKDNTLNIHFDLPDASSPEHNDRILALAFYSMVIVEK